MKQILHKTINDSQMKAEMKVKACGHQFYIIAPKYDEFGWDDNMKITDFFNLVNTYQELYVYNSKTDELMLYYSVEKER